MLLSLITILLIVIFILAVSLNSCSTKETEQNNVYRLHDIWALESIEGEKIIIDKTIKNLPMIEIYVEDEIVRGNTSCNTINGRVNIDNNKISFYDISTTEMACPGDLEQRFLSALRKVNCYKIEKLKLYLNEDDKELLSFQKVD